MKFKETTAQNVALHTLQSLLLSALITFLVGCLQFVGLHGFNWQALATFAIGSFLGQMTMIWKTLQGNPTVLQAIMDTLNEVQGLVTQSPSPVTIHNNLPAPAPAEVVAPVVPPAPQAPQAQFAFPYSPSSTFPLPVVQAGQPQ